jgi:DUF1365 family protein
VLGYTFKPVSSGTATATGALRAIVVEVNNTFTAAAPAGHAALRPQTDHNKVFHVSPFARFRLTYRFRFFGHPEDGATKNRRRVDYDDEYGALLEPASAARWNL